VLLLRLLDDPLVADGAVAALRRYSLISPRVEGSVSVHRLVQAITLGQFPAEQAAAWRQAAGFLVTAALPADAQKPGNWPVYAALLPHAQAVLAADSEPMMRIASYLGYSGTTSQHGPSARRFSTPENGRSAQSTPAP
jgi:hypothetical protein